MKKSVFITATLLSVGLQGCLLPSLARPIELDNDCQSSGIGTKALESIYNSKRNAVVRLEVGGGIGTAFVVSDDGLALTAAHVVRGQQNIKAKFFDRSLHSVRVISLHANLDLALVKLETRQPLSVLKLESAPSQVGESVFSIGNSCNDFLAARFGKVLEVSSRSWKGLESGLVRLKLPLAPGDSGAPVLNLNGRVIGLVRAGGDDGRGFAGYAIPSAQMMDWVKRTHAAFSR